MNSFPSPFMLCFILLPLVFTDATLRPQGRRNSNRIRKRGIQVQMYQNPVATLFLQNTSPSWDPVSHRGLPGLSALSGTVVDNKVSPSSSDRLKANSRIQRGGTDSSSTRRASWTARRSDERMIRWSCPAKDSGRNKITVTKTQLGFLQTFYFSKFHFIR